MAVIRVRRMLLVLRCARMNRNRISARRIAEKFKAEGRGILETMTALHRAGFMTYIRNDGCKEPRFLCITEPSTGSREGVDWLG